MFPESCRLLALIGREEACAFLATVPPWVAPASLPEPVIDLREWGGECYWTEQQVRAWVEMCLLECE